MKNITTIEQTIGQCMWFRFLNLPQFINPSYKHFYAVGRKRKPQNGIYVFLFVLFSCFTLVFGRPITKPVCPTLNHLARKWSHIYAAWL